MFCLGILLADVRSLFGAIRALTLRGKADARQQSGKSNRRHEETETTTGKIPVPFPGVPLLGLHTKGRPPQAQTKRVFVGDDPQ